MHELALMDSLVSAVGERVGPERVVVVRLEVGRLSAVVPEALRFCFEMCARGTALEGAALEIIDIAGRASCRECKKQMPADGPIVVCACGSTDVEIVTGQELRIREVEVV